MDNNNLCRICLGEGATLPIFTNEDNANSISTKLSICIQQQVLEDDGFPTKICSVCHALLDITYGFLERYKESCRIFQSKLNNLKPPSPENSDNEKPYFDDAASCSSEPEIFLSEIKMEQDAQMNAQRSGDNFLDVDNFLHIDMGQGETKNCVYLEEKIVTKVPKKKRLKTSKKVKVKKRKKNNVHTNNIAASLLECAFQWDGDRWCYSNVESLSKPDTKKSTLENRKAKYARLLDVRKALKRKRKTENKSTKPYLCHECGLVFKEVSYLKKHVKLMHMMVKAKELTCTAPDCKKVFASEHNLMKHYKRVHSKDKEYVCSECGRQFAFKNELTGHMKTHNRGLYPKKDYSCKFCSQKYKTQKSVDIHERSAHTGERPSKCKVCDAAFFHDDYLKEHMRLHTGETPYKCPICGRGYAQRGNMKSHLRVHRISELDETARSTMKPNYLKLLRA